jgi:hypothetical protein
MPSMISVVATGRRMKRAERFMSRWLLAETLRNAVPYAS